MLLIPHSSTLLHFKHLTGDIWFQYSWLLSSIQNHAYMKIRIRVTSTLRAWVLQYLTYSEVFNGIRYLSFKINRWGWRKACKKLSICSPENLPDMQWAIGLNEWMIGYYLILNSRKFAVLFICVWDDSRCRLALVTVPFSERIAELQCLASTGDLLSASLILSYNSMWMVLSWSVLMTWRMYVHFFSKSIFSTSGL